MGEFERLFQRNVWREILWFKKNCAFFCTKTQIVDNSAAYFLGVTFFYQYHITAGSVWAMLLGETIFQFHLMKKWEKNQELIFLGSV